MQHFQLAPKLLLWQQQGSGLSISIFTSWGRLGWQAPSYLGEVGLCKLATLSTPARAMLQAPW